MRILHVVPAYAPAWDYGGPARVAYELSRSLHHRGHQVTVFTTDAFLPTRLSQPALESVEEGIRVVRMRNISKSVAERLRLFCPKDMRTYAEKDIASFDIVHIHEYRTIYNRWICRAALEAGVPYVISPHGAATLNGQRELPKRAFDGVVGKRILRAATMVFALTSDEARYLIGLPEVTSPVVTIPNGTSIPDEVAQELVQQRRATWGLSSRAVVLYFGRIARSKGIDLLLHAFAEASLQSSAHLVICGPDDGAVRPLTQLASELGISSDTTFAEPVYGVERDITLQAADVVALPRFTGLPMVLLEAAANARPAVVAIAAPELPWLDGQGGLTTGDDPAEYGGALRSVLHDDRATQMGRAARSCVERDFSWDAIAGEYETQYQSVVESRTRLSA